MAEQAIAMVGLSHTRKAAQLLQGHRRLALSGTPIENHLGELQSSKRKLAAAIINQDNRLIRTLSKEDLALLLS